MNKKWLLLAVIGIPLAAGAVVLLRQSTLSRASAASNVPTTTVQRGDLAATVAAAGNIAPQNSVNLNFATTGTVDKVNVKAGDHVKSGDVLATLDTTDLNLQIQQAQITLKLAQMKLAQVKAGPTAAALAGAQSSLASAQANLAKLTSGSNAAAVASARSALVSAQDKLAKLKAGPDPTTIQKDQNALTQAQNSLTASYATRDATCGHNDATSCNQARAGVANAQLAVQKAQATLATDQAGPTAADLNEAELAVQQAQAQLNAAYTSTTAADIDAANKQVQQAQANLDALQPTQDDITLAQADVDNAQTALAQAQLKLQGAQIVAPFDGVVAALNLTAGQAASTSTTAIQLADLAHLQIVVNMAEVDVTRIQLGQPVDITLDALPDLKLKGQVSDIALAGTQTQGVVNYPVTIQVSKPPATVKSGMTANLSVTVQQRLNVLYVPNRAIQTRGAQKFVTVLFEGQQIPTPVTVGLSNDSSTEVLTGLQEGDTVVLNQTSTASTTRGGAQFQVGPGGPPPGD